MTAAQQTEPKLANQGIATAAARMGWERGRSAWGYIAKDEIRGGQTTRFKAIKSGASRKYFWSKQGKPDDVIYYHAPDIHANIEAADGKLYIAAGEKDVLTYIAAGHENVLSWFGEMNVPATLPQDLQALGVSYVVYAPDRDETGRKSAIKLRDTLAGTGIHLEIKQLPDAVGDKGDTNDLWQHVDFDPAAFIDAITAAPELDLPAPEPKQPVWESRDFGNDDTPPELINLLAGALNLRTRHMNSGGWARKNVCCPFHDDHTPSATLNLISGVLHCHTCGDSFSPQAVADKLGIDTTPFYSQRQQTGTVSKRGLSNAPGDTGHISSWAQPVELPPLAADITTDNRYISDVDESVKHRLLEHRSILIKSPLNTGKTSLLQRLIETDKCERVLIVTHLENLAHDIKSRFEDLGFIVYKDFQGQGIHWQGHDRIVCSYDSLHQLSGQHFDMVAIDEIEQFLAHTWGDTMTGGENERAYRTLQQLVGSAAHFIAQDAHLTTKTRQFAAELRGQDIITLRNDYTHQWGDLTLCRSPYVVIERGLQAAQTADKPIVFVSSSRKRSRVLYQMCLDKGFTERQVMLINGDTSQRQQQKDFRRDINRNLSGVKILIASPSLGTGIDIQTEVHGVYALFGKQPLIATQMLQMLGRYRHAGERWAWVQYADNQGYETNPAALQGRAISRAYRTADTADFESHAIDPVPPAQRQIQALQAAWDADANQQRNRLFSSFVAYANAEGYTIKYDNRAKSGAKEAYQQAKEALARRRQDLTLTSEAVSPDAHRELKKSGQSTDATDAGLLRWQIENVTGFEIMPDTYELFKTRSQRQKLRRFMDLSDDLDHLKDTDRREAQQGTLISKRSHLTVVRILVSEAIAAVFGADGLDSELELTRHEIEARLVDFIAEHGQDILHHIDRRGDLSEDTLNIFRRVLGKVGIKLGYRQVMENGARFYRYFIDKDHLTLWRNIARVGLAYRRTDPAQGRDKRDYLKHVIGLSSIRDLSNPDDLPSVGGEGSGDYARWEAQIEAIPV